MSGLPRWLPRNDTLVAPGDEGAEAVALNLVLTKTRPAGYTAAVDPAKGWVTWGHAGNRVPSNIATPFTFSTGLKVWLAMTTNGAHPVQVLSCVLAAGSDVPADIGGTETTPPTTVHFLLGSVGGAGTVESPWSVFSSGQGNLRLETYEVGTVCQTYSPGPPPVPASIKSTYATRVVRV